MWTRGTRTLNMGHVMQAFVGSEFFPRFITNGIVEFDHETSNLSTVNTCPPSILFSSIAGLQAYDKCENHMLNIIVCSPEFGIA